MGSKNYVMRLSLDGYELALLGPTGEHTPIEDAGRVFMPRGFPEGMELKAEINGELVQLDKGFDEDYQNVPGIYLFSNGEITPFLLSVESEGQPRYQVQGDYSGKVTYLGRESDG